MLAFRNQTSPFRKLAQENLEASQEDIKQWFDQNATLGEFYPRQNVWVMAPAELSALQDKWTGTFDVVERKSDVTYLVILRTPRNPLSALHVAASSLTLRGQKNNLATDDGVEEESEPLPDLLSAKVKDGLVEGVNLSTSLTLEQQTNYHQVL
ncbi:hypothetical protein NDU88_004430 [Pleurodeles waltl]|uniref:Uncharacterized protein n=1 Tax=Pleurodeles waltl TaxID=8319 RepID=A0AAV7KZF7_PLEWA|nr:hypothetical protein NDU88_004430 [Pleurodeles waltl]